MVKDHTFALFNFGTLHLAATCGCPRVMSDLYKGSVRLPGHVARDVDHVPHDQGGGVHLQVRAGHSQSWRISQEDLTPPGWGGGGRSIPRAASLVSGVDILPQTRG